MSIMTLDGYHAKIEYDADLDLFRGEVFGLNGGADFYGKNAEELRAEFKKSLQLFLDVCCETGLSPRKNLALGRKARTFEGTKWRVRGKRTMFDYPAVLAAQPDGGFVVTFPDVPEAITQGEDRDEALLCAVDALETALSFYVDDRRHLPLPSGAKRGQAVVRPGPLESAKFAFYAEAMR